MTAHPENIRYIVRAGEIKPLPFPPPQTPEDWGAFFRWLDTMQPDALIAKVRAYAAIGPTPPVDPAAREGEG